MAACVGPGASAKPGQNEDVTTAAMTPSCRPSDSTLGDAMYALPEDKSRKEASL